jgi:hypothetical protein
VAREIEHAREHVLDAQRGQQRAGGVHEGPEALELDRAIGGGLDLRLDFWDGHGVSSNFHQIALQTVIVNQYNVEGENVLDVTQRIDQRVDDKSRGVSAERDLGAGQAIDVYQQGAGANWAQIDESYDQQQLSERRSLP